MSQTEYPKKGQLMEQIPHQKKMYLRYNGLQKGPRWCRICSIKSIVHKAPHPKEKPCNMGSKNAFHPLEIPLECRRWEPAMKAKIYQIIGGHLAHCFGVSPGRQLSFQHSEVHQLRKPGPQCLAAVLGPGHKGSIFFRSTLTFGSWKG